MLTDSMVESRPGAFDTFGKRRDFCSNELFGRGRDFGRMLSVVLLMICSLLSTGAQAADSDYRLGSGDLLRVNVFGSPELSGEVRVSESGNITYPLVGQVQIAGKSPTQVEAQLVSQFT